MLRVGTVPKKLFSYNKILLSCLERIKEIRPTSLIMEERGPFWLPGKCLWQTQFLSANEHMKVESDFYRSSRNSWKNVECECELFQL